MKIFFTVLIILITISTIAFGQSIDTAQYHFESGIRFMNQNNYEAAIDEFTNAIQLNSNYIQAYTNRSNAYYKNKEYIMAIADCNMAIRIDPNYADAYSNRGNVYFAKCKNTWGEVISTVDYDRAIEDYTYAIRLDSSAWRYASRGNAFFAKCKNRWGEVISVEDSNRAITDFDHAIKLGPTAWRYTERGEVYLAQKDYNSAIVDFSKAIELEPTTWRYNLLGNAYLWKGDYSNAIRIYTRDTRTYRIQLSAINDYEIENYEMLKNLGFNIRYEWIVGNIYQPIISGICGTDVTITFQKIFAAGYKNFWVREGN